MACAEIMEDSSLARFRTKLCRRHTAEGCDFCQRCQYSHNTRAQRRCPFLLLNKVPHNILRYLPILCPDTILIKPDEKCFSSYQSDPRKCKRGVGCPFSHSLEEILFHPLVYKQKLCESFHSDKLNCNEYYCPFVHNLSEKRHIPLDMYQIAPSINRQLTFPMAQPLNLLKTYNSSEPQIELKPSKSFEMCSADSLSSSLSKKTNLEGETLFVAAPYKQNNISMRESNGRLLSAMPGDVFEIIVDNTWKNNGDSQLANFPPIYDTSNIKVFFAKCIWGSSVGAVGWIPASIMFGIDENTVKPEQLFKSISKGPSIHKEYVISNEESNEKEPFYNLVSNAKYCKSPASSNREQYKQSEASEQSEFTIPMYKTGSKIIRDVVDSDVIDSSAMKKLSNLMNSNNNNCSNDAQETLWKFLSQETNGQYEGEAENENTNIFNENNEDEHQNSVYHNNCKNEEDIISEHLYPTLLGMEVYEPPAANRQYDRVTLLNQRSSIDSINNASINNPRNSVSSILPTHVSKEFLENHHMTENHQMARENESKKLSTDILNYKLLHHLSQAEKEIQYCITIAHQLINNNLDVHQQTTKNPEKKNTELLINLMEKILNSSTNTITKSAEPQVSEPVDEQASNGYQTLLGSENICTHLDKNSEMKTPTVIQRIHLSSDDPKTNAISTVSTADNTDIIINCCSDNNSDDN